MAYIDRINSGIIPDKLHVVREGKSEDEIIGYIVPVIKDGTFSSKLATARKKIYQKWALEELEIDNIPQSGYSFMNLARRYSTQNTFWRIVTPQNFETEISSENLFHLINNCTIEDGLIKSEVVWIKTTSGLWLTSTETEDYKQSVPEVQYSAKVGLRDCKPGYKVKLRGDKNEYTYLGSLHFASMDVGGRWGRSNIKEINYNRYYITKNESGTLSFNKSLIVTEITDRSTLIPVQDIVTECTNKFDSNNTIISSKPLPKGLYDYEFSMEKIDVKDLEKSKDKNDTPLNHSRNFYLLLSKSHCWLTSTTYKNNVYAYKVEPIVLKDGSFPIDKLSLRVNTSSYYNRLDASTIDYSDITEAYAIKWKVR